MELLWAYPLFAVLLSPVLALGRDVIFKERREAQCKGVRLGQDPQQCEWYQGISEIPFPISRAK